ncbi:MAG: YtxH domain-containing protein [Candidatus Shapirobacteria bacterium]|jgi:gas vesicle protein
MSNLSKNGGKFFLAGIMGAIAGAIGGLLLAPQSGKETRAEITAIANKILKEIKGSLKETEGKAKEVFGDTTKGAVDKYNEVRETVAGKVAAVKKAGNQIDRSKYGMIVDDVVEEFKGDIPSAKKGAEKLAGQLKKDWDKVKKALT